MFEKIPGNVRKDSGECSRRFRGMFKRITGNVQEDSGECSKRFRGILTKIRENAQKDWTIYNAIKQNRIKGCILKYNQKYAQKLIKTSHMNEHV